MKIFKSALVLTLVGIACGVLIGLTNLVTEPVIKENQLKIAREAYEGFFPELDDLKITEVEGTYVYEYVEILKGEEVIGHAFKAKGSNPRGLIDLAIGADIEGKILGVKILSTENTPGYYDKYEDSDKYLIGVDGTTLGDVKGIDNISGATQTGDSLNNILKEVGEISGEYVDSTPVVELSPYEVIFGENVTETLDYETSVTKTISLPEASTVDEEVTVTKEEVYDEDNNLVGYAYSGKVNTDLIPRVESADLILMVGVDLEGKVIGVETVLSEHTPGFYAYWEDALANLNDLNLEDLEVDGVTGATVSQGFINGIFEAVKEVITNE